MSTANFRAQLALFEAKARADLDRAIKAQRLQNWLTLEAFDRWLEHLPGIPR